MDWTGNNKSAFTCNGCSNHSTKERQNEDYYATEPKATRLLLELETFRNVWEPASGGGHIAGVLREKGIAVRCSDIVKRTEDTEQKDFLLFNDEKWDGDIVTNPPYKYALDFVKKSIECVNDGCKVAMFLKLTFLEGKARKKFFEEHPPRTVYVSSSRLQCAMNGDFKTYKEGTGTAVAYAWYVWEKGFKGNTTIKWFN